MQVNIYINLLVYKYTYYVAYEQQDYFLWNPSNSPVIFAEKRLTASITKAKLISLYFIRYGQLESIIGSISPLQRPHYFTSSYTYLFLKKVILLSFLG